MKKRILATILGLVVAASTVLAGCGGGSDKKDDAASSAPTAEAPADNTSNEAEYIIRYSSVNPATDNKNVIVLTAWGNWINEASDGRVKIEFHYSNEACKAEDALTSVKNGIVDIAEFGSGYWSSDFPYNSSLVLPMVYNFCDSWTWSYVLDDMRAKYPEFESEWTDKGVTLISWAASGSSNFFGGKDKPAVKTLDDFQGKISNCFSNYEKMAVQELGGIPEMLAPTDVYDALSKGVIDICNVPYTGATALSVKDAASTVTEINLGTCVWGIVMNNDVLASMPEDLQELFTADENRSRLRNWFNYQFVCDEFNYKAEDVASGDFEIVSLPEDELAKFKAKMDPIYAEWKGQIDAAGGNGEEVFKDFQDASAKYDYKTYQSGMDVTEFHDSLEKYYGKPLPEQFVTVLPEL